MGLLQNKQLLSSAQGLKGLKVAVLGLSTALRLCSLLYPWPPREFPHSSPEAPRTTQARETSTSEGGN
jgi:hypothetical protein